MSYLLLNADARRIPLADGSVHCCVTSPPYFGLRNYGCDGQIGLEPTPDAFVAAMVEVFREVKRVLRPDGTCWVNLGDSFNSSPSNQQGRNGTSSALISPKYGVDGMAGTGRQKRDIVGLKPKDLIGIPWRVAFALQADGWWLRSDIIWAKPNPMPESVTDRPTKSHEYVFLLAKRERYWFDAEAVREASPPDYAANGRIRPSMASHAVADPVRGATKTGLHLAEPSPYRNIRSVWTITPEPYPGAHFATYPRKLVEPCVKAGCPLGGIVFDPFAGSGTTLQVADALGRHGIGLDLSREYLELARRRLSRPHAKVPRPGKAEPMPLFD